MIMIELKNIEVTFQNEENSVQAVKDVSLSVEKGDIYGIVGYSGAGKSTLVRTINFLQRPTAGEVFVNGKKLSVLTSDELRTERQKIGMIFKHFNLMRQTSAFDNMTFS